MADKVLALRACKYSYIIGLFTIVIKTTNWTDIRRGGGGSFSLFIRHNFDILFFVFGG